MIVAGVFVGGKARRMGGVPKGLIPHPTEPWTVVEHVVREARAVGAEPLLVGEASAYALLGLPSVEDAMAEVGPAGGMLALFRHAQGGIALALSCDLPYVRAKLLEELIEGVRGGAAAMVPRRGDKLEPLCAAYRADAMRVHVETCLGQGIRSLHRMARAVGAVEIDLEGDRARWLDDWDTPEDVGPAVPEKWKRDRDR